MSPLADLGMRAIVATGDGNQVRLWEAGTESKLALWISVEGLWGKGICLQILSCAAHWVCAFSGLSPLSLLAASHVCPCTASCLLLTQSSHLHHFILHMALQGTASAVSIDLQSHFLETKFYLNTKEVVLQRSL